MGYDLDDYWIDVTTIGDSHEIQLNTRTNEYRHRELTPSVYSRREKILRVEDFMDPEWKPGRPPEPERESKKGSGTMRVPNTGSRHGKEEG